MEKNEFKVFRSLCKCETNVIGLDPGEYATATSQNK